MVSIRALVPGIALAPTLALVGFAGLYLSDRWVEYAGGASLQAQVERATAADNLAHALQLERGRSVLSLQPGIDGAGDLQIARDATNLALVELRARLQQGGDLPGGLGAARDANLQASIGRIEGLRADVSQRKDTAENVLHRYSTIIDADIDLLDDAARQRASLSSEVGRDLAVYAALAHGKEFAGMERALGAIAVSRARLQREEMARVEAVAGAQEGAFQAIPRLASSAFAARWAAFGISPETHAVEAMRDAMNLDIGRSSTISPAVWFTTATARIDLLHRLEGDVAASALARLRADQSAAGWVLFIAVCATILAIAGAVTVAVFVARAITEPLRRVTAAKLRLAAGDLDTSFEIGHAPDEIVAMVKAMEVFRDSLRANQILMRELAQGARMASLGALVAGIAHEVNTPIGNALMVSSALGENIRRFAMEASSGAVRRSSISRHVGEVEEASRLLQINLDQASQHIRSFKQIAVDQTSDHRRAFNLRKCVEDAVRSCTPLLRDADVRISCDVAADIEMDSYPGAFTQVVINLVENAVRHGLPDVLEGQVRIEGRKVSATEARLVVADNGVGIPDDLAAKVFNAFFTTREASGGTGLGLHIVKSIVTGQLAGAIALEARSGGGARFVISLPCAVPVENAGTETIFEPRDVAA